MALLLTAAQTTLVLLYAVLLYVAFDYVAEPLLGRPVPGLWPLVALWCAVILFQVMRTGGALLMQMQRQFKALTLMNLPSAAIAIGTAAALTALLGQAGAVAGTLAGEMVLAFLIWRGIRHAANTQ
jgi:O-antigen/teichoic acid export membrane protein